MKTLSNNSIIRLEINALQHELSDLKSLKIIIENEIKDFSIRYDEELGELLLKLLEIRSKYSEEVRSKDNNHKETTQETDEYNTYKESLDLRRSKYKPTLSPSDLSKLKKAFRMASKLCHPDIATPSNKEKANKIFVQLLTAYEDNNLELVLKILTNLQNNGLNIDVDYNEDPSINLQQKLESLKSEISVVRDEIKQLQKTEAYKIASSTKRIDDYFSIKKIEIEKEIQSLLSKYGES